MRIAGASAQGWRLFSIPPHQHASRRPKEKDPKQIRAWGPHNSDAYLALGDRGGDGGERPVYFNPRKRQAARIQRGSRISVGSWCCCSTLKHHPVWACAVPSVCGLSYRALCKAIAPAQSIHAIKPPKTM